MSVMIFPASCSHGAASTPYEGALVHATRAVPAYSAPEQDCVAQVVREARPDASQSAVCHPGVHSTDCAMHLSMSFMVGSSFCPPALRPLVYTTGPWSLVSERVHSQCDGFAFTHFLSHPLPVPVPPIPLRTHWSIKCRPSPSPKWKHSCKSFLALWLLGTIQLPRQAQACLIRIWHLGSIQKIFTYRTW